MYIYSLHEPIAAPEKMVGGMAGLTSHSGKDVRLRSGDVRLEGGSAWVLAALNSAAGRCRAGLNRIVRQQIK